MTDRLGAAMVFLLLVVGSAMAWWTMVYSHEQVHVRTCETYGGDASVSYGLASAVTRCDLPSLDGQDYRDWKALNVQNEIVGYHAQALLLGMMLGFVMVVCAVLVSGMHERRGLF